jgi:hypothetical protein
MTDSRSLMQSSDDLLSLSRMMVVRRIARVFFSFDGN